MTPHGEQSQTAAAARNAEEAAENAELNALSITCAASHASQAPHASNGTAARPSAPVPEQLWRELRLLQASFPR